MRLVLPGLLALSLLAAVHSARAEVDVRALSAAVAGGGLSERPLSAVVRAPHAGRLPSDGDVLPIGRGFGTVRASLDELTRLATRHPSWEITWTPPRRLLVDRAAERMGAVQVRQDSGLTGQGVAVGIVDTGLDITHPDFRNADGTTRVRWFVDLEAPPVGLHPEAEALCDRAGFSCAVYSKADLDAQLDSGRTVVSDNLGHGTHVASIAAGSGSSEASGRFAGVAPEAELVIARGSAGALSIDDVDVLSAVEILYFLVEDYGPSLGQPRMPMVMNLSLGSDIGPHDGSSVLGEGLSALVTDEHAGRAIVVAVGNSGTVFAGLPSFPEPLGIHTNVHTFNGSIRVPLVIPRIQGASRTRGEVLVWIEMSPGDDLSVGLEDGDGPMMSPVPPGGARSARNADLQVTIVNGARPGVTVLPETRPGALVLIEGQWSSSETFAVRLQGTGTAEVWVQPGGALDPLVGGVGVLVPGATKEGTVNIPAAHPELISVGATLNRLEWSDRSGRTVEVASTIRGGLGTGAPAIFSSAGPNVDGHVRPDIVAPGGWVIAALSAQADPTENPFSIFHQSASCEPSPECALASDAYAVSAGTSMAAPMVAGAVALLFERDPSLTHGDIRGILRGSARAIDAEVRVEQQVGTGELDVVSALMAVDEQAAPSGRQPAAPSRIVLGSSYAVPGSEGLLRGLLVLRDAEDRIAEGFEESKLALTAAPHGEVLALVPEGPGLRSFSVSVPAGSGGDFLELRLAYDGTTLGRSRLPIAVDVNVARHGLFASGGCALAKGSLPHAALSKPGHVAGSMVWIATCLAWRGRRRRRGLRAERNLDRMGSSVSPLRD